MFEGNHPRVHELFIDGYLINGGMLSGNEKSFGILMHSLSLGSRMNLRQIASMEDVFRLSSGVEPTNFGAFDDAVNAYLRKNGFDSQLIANLTPRISEVEIDENCHSLQAAAYQMNGKIRVVSRGTAQELLKRCTHVIVDSRAVKITRKLAASIMSALYAMQEKGRAVYAVAVKDMRIMTDIGSNKSNGYTLVAMLGV